MPPFAAKAATEFAGPKFSVELLTSNGFWKGPAHSDLCVCISGCWPEHLGSGLACARPKILSTLVGGVVVIAFWVMPEIVAAFALMLSHRRNAYLLSYITWRNNVVRLSYVLGHEYYGTPSMMVYSAALAEVPPKFKKRQSRWSTRIAASSSPFPDQGLHLHQPAHHPSNPWSLRPVVMTAVVELSQRHRS